VIVVTGALIAVLATFPLAVLCAIAFRFPGPFAGYLGVFALAILDKVIGPW